MPTPHRPRIRSSTITFEGLERSFRLSAAPPAGSAPRPLVVVLHGGFGTGIGVTRQGDWDRAAQRHGFVVLSPDGTSKSWNAGTCCGPPARDDVDDVGFVLAAIDAVAAEHPVDTRRVFATGISNGGMMAYRLGCEAPERFAAIAPVAATLMFGPGPRAPISLLHAHGLDDQFVPYTGGLPTRTAQRTPPRYLPVEEAVARFVRVNGCPSPPVVERDGVLTTTRWGDGAAGTAVELVTIAGGTHSWPGGHRLLRALDPPSPALDATETIWSFFESRRSTAPI